MRHPVIETGASEWKSEMLPLHQWRFVRKFNTLWGIPIAVLETATFRLEGGRSIQLSYTGGFLNSFLIFFSLFLRNFKEFFMLEVGFEPTSNLIQKFLRLPP